MKQIDINECSEIIVTDNSEYVPEKSHDGGCYSFSTIYRKTVEGTWMLTFETSADFDYCPICGSFGNHYDYEEDEYTCGEPHVVTTEELLERLADIEDNEDYDVTFID